jgi:hypothetical protein
MQDSFFYTEFQKRIEEAEAFMSADNDPSRPYDMKYKARELLSELLSHSELQHDSDLSKAAQGIIEYLLGVNHFETEEITQSEKHYKRSYDILTGLEPRSQAKYLVTVQDLLNSLGILCCNRGENSEGLAFFEKAIQLYNLLKNHASKSFTTNFNEFLSTGQDFKFIIQGGINPFKLEQNYTFTLFYLAQAYSKMNQKDKAAGYCAETMRRQIESGDYQTKDWAINAINMAEYYIEHEFLNQALYTLQVAYYLLPTGSKKKLRSTLHMQMGRCLESFLRFGMEYLQEGQSVPESVHSQQVLFTSIPVPFPKYNPPTDLESAKNVFRLAMPHFNKAFEYFVIDGYVTEHVEMKKDVSSLYKYLCFFEDNRGRIVAMMERRLECIEGYIKELNKQAYSTLWQKLMNEVATIYIDLYELKHATLVEKSNPTPAGFNKTNKFALTSIELQTELLDFVQKFEMNDENASDVIQSCLNLIFGIARIYGKLEHPVVKNRVSYMERSLRWYERAEKYLLDMKSSKFSAKIPDMQEHLRISREMVALLPIRISQVNAGID